MVKEWEKVQIGECFDFKNGLNKGKDYFGTGTPIINYMDVYKKRGMHKEDIKGRVTLSSEEISRFKVEKNDVFFTRTSETPEEVGFASVLLDDIENCVFSGFVLRARPKNQKLYPAFCQYCFMTNDIRQAIEKSCTYTTRALTNGKVLSMIEIALPPYDEQLKISEAISDIDELISSLEKLIAKKKAIKQGAMQQLLTGKTRLPGFGGKWVTKTIGDIASIGRGRVISHKEINDNLGGQYPVFSSQTANDGIMGYLRSYDFDGEYITWTTDGVNAGTVFYRNGKFNCTNVCGTIRLYDDYPSFVAQILSIEAPKYVSTNLANPKLMNDVMKKVEIAVPNNKEEQKAIADNLTNMNNDIELLEKKLRKSQQIKYGMMQQLLTGKTRLV